MPDGGRILASAGTCAAAAALPKLILNACRQMPSSLIFSLAAYSGPASFSCTVGSKYTFSGARVLENQVLVLESAPNQDQGRSDKG